MGIALTKSYSLAHELNYVGPDDMRKAANASLETSAQDALDFRPPSFDRSAYAAASRKAGRLNASFISEEEFESLLNDRRLLIEKIYSGEATKADRNRLEYVNWSLDRIEDAQHGEHLDRLEEAVGRYEQFLAEIRDLRRQLNGVVGGKRRR